MGGFYTRNSLEILDFLVDPQIFIGDHKFSLETPIFPLETTRFSSETPQIFIGDPQIFIGDHRFSFETPIFSLETPRFSSETPQIFIGDPQIFIGDHRFSLETPKIFLGNLQIFIGDLQIFIGDLLDFHKNQIFIGDPKDIMQGNLFQRYTHLLYCRVVSLGDNVNTRRMSKPDMGSIFHIKKQWNILVIENYYVNYQKYQNLSLLPPSDTNRTLMHLFLFTNFAKRELVSICTQSIHDRN